MPAEWERHAATWLAWPHNPETWVDCVDAAEAEYQGLVEAIAQAEPTHVLVKDAEHRAAVAARFRGKSLPIHLHVVPTDDAWIRDTGPTFVHDGKGGLSAVDWGFNSWGGKYPPWDRDAEVAGHVARLASARHLRATLTLEGGALEVDGEGTLLATRSSILTPTRNPGRAVESVEEELRQRLGVTQIVWLDAELAGDDTDGHIDNVARFVAPGRVVCARVLDPAHPNHAILEECRATLLGSRDAHGRALEVIDLPLPPAIEVDGARLPGSYVNFLIANGRVVMPSFGVASDARAAEILAKCLPGRDVVSVPCLTLVRGFGGPHCLSQQQPAPE